MMDLIQRDRDNLVDGLLVAINANDKLNFNMQNNVIPVAAAKNMGIIAMKVFADGAMYTKGAHWSNQPAHVVRQVGSNELPFRSLIEYSLTTPGISTLIIGIGQISEDSEQCQLTQNIEAAQISPDGLSESDRAAIEKMAGRVKEGKTNYFQMEKGGLTAARNARAEKSGSRQIRITWDTAYAGSNPIERYEVWRNDNKAGEVRHMPQTSKKPFAFEDTLADPGRAEYRVITVDRQGKRVETEKIPVL
jgi:hypothetical protein